MRRPRPFYFLRRALLNLRGAPLPAFVTAATIAVAIFLFGAFLLSAENAYRALVGWTSEGDPLLVYAPRKSSPNAVEALARRISALPEVGRVRVIAPEEGLRDLRRALGDDAAVLEGIEAREVLPPVVSVALAAPAPEPAAVEALAARLRTVEGVDAVDSVTAWLERFSKLAAALRWVGAAWAAMLGVGVLLVIGNSTRLAALTRKEEIEVLTLVGASDAFVVMPFFLEGAIQGLAGSLAGLGALAGTFYGIERLFAGDPFFAPFLAGLEFLEPRLSMALLAAGPLLGALGSAGAARRHLQGVAL
ncbi:MAG: cell division protein FtsX [Candidatus Binatia bacterium]